MEAAVAELVDADDPQDIDAIDVATLTRTTRWLTRLDVDDQAFGGELS